MQFHTIKVNGLNVFYRESGPLDKPVFLAAEFANL